MIFIFYILAALLVYSSYKSFRGGVDYLDYFKKQLARPRPDFLPFVSIIAPCKGVDDGLRENLLALTEQDHPNFEVIFVVDSESDGAVPVINEISRRNTKLAVAGRTLESSQKVENLREAVLHVAENCEILVFVDSDVRPSKTWLRDLIAPLEDGSVGAATGYRWFISKPPGFASELRSAWNASIASVLGPNTRSNFCWGGSTAIRRDVFERLEVRERWRGTASDDLALTRILKEAGLPIHFVPQALTPSVENCTFGHLLEFTTRQIKITRVYAPHLWLLSFLGSGLFTVVLIWAVLIISAGRFTTVPFWIAALTAAAVAAFSIGKSYLRLKAVELVLTEYRREIRRQFFPQMTLWLFAAPLYFYNCAAALVSRRIAWRGRVYRLTSASETSIEPD